MPVAVMKVHLLPFKIYFTAVNLNSCRNEKNTGEGDKGGGAAGKQDILLLQIDFTLRKK